MFRSRFGLRPTAESPDAVAVQETLLHPRQQHALRAGLQDTAVPKTSDEFNRRLLSALFSGRDLRPWQAQAATRLRWMLPALPVGLGITLALSYLLNTTLQEAPKAKIVPRPVVSAPPPPLPPMPTRFILAPPSALRTDTGDRYESR